MARLQNIGRHGHRLNISQVLGDPLQDLEAVQKPEICFCAGAQVSSPAFLVARLPGHCVQMSRNNPLGL